MGFKIVILFLNNPKVSNDKCKQVKADVQIAAEGNVLGRNRVKHRGVCVCICVTLFKIYFPPDGEKKESLAVYPNRIFPPVTQWDSLLVQAGAGAAVSAAPTHPRGRVLSPSLCPAPPSACALRPPQPPAATSSQGGSLCLCLTADACSGDPAGRVPRAPAPAWRLPGRAAGAGSGHPPHHGFSSPGRAGPAAGCRVCGGEE